jgi:hypothetical protein
MQAERKRGSMIRIQIDQVPMLVMGAAFGLTVLRWVSLHIGLWAVIRATPVADRWRLYREFARAHRLGTGTPVLILKIFRGRPERAPAAWPQRGYAASRIAPTDVQQDF